MGYISVEVYDGGVLVEERGGPATFRPAPIETRADGGLQGEGVAFSTTDFTTGPGFVGDDGTYRLRREMDTRSCIIRPESHYYRAVALTAPDQVIDFDGFSG